MDNSSSDAAQLNQTMVRHPDSVWDRRGWNGTADGRMTTRLLVGIGGAALALQGLRRGAWPGRAFVTIGSSLTWWAISGTGDLNDTRRWFGEILHRRGPESDDRMVTNASADSFPASDSPSWTPTVGTGLRRKVRR